jgi:hypothetical protein
MCEVTRSPSWDSIHRWTRGRTFFGRRGRCRRRWGYHRHASVDPRPCGARDCFPKIAFHLDWPRQVLRCPDTVEVPFERGAIVHFSTCDLCDLSLASAVAVGVSTLTRGSHGSCASDN